MQINKYNIIGNSKRVDHDYKVWDKFILDNNNSYKYENPFKGPFVIKQVWTNDTMSLQYGAINIG